MYKEEHQFKMAEIQKGNDSFHVNPSVSPYSILRLSAQDDIDDTIQQITMNVGPRSTRAQLLK